MKNISYWQKTATAKQHPSIPQNMDVDIAIIGGGMTGVMCAYYLRNSGKKIAVFEQHQMGCQTTGHTTGKISFLHGTIYQFLIRYYNTEIARMYMESNIQAMHDIENIIKEEDIQCDFQMNKAFIYTKSQHKIKTIEKEIEALTRLGVHVLVDQHRDKNILKSFAVEEQAIFHPLKYLHSIVEVCQRSNILFYENSNAYAFDIQKDITKFKCNDFTVRSKQTIFATRYPQINYPELYFLKLSQSREHLVYNNVSKMRNSYLSVDNPNQTYRPAGNGTIYGGYKHEVGKRTDKINILENNKKIFGDVESIAWAAQDTSTNRGIPYIGYFSPKYNHCYLACGFNKWGMTLSHVSARVLSDMILHNDNPYQLLYSPEYGNTATSLASFGNILKSSIKGMIINRFAPMHMQLHKGEGKVVRLGGKLFAIYKDDHEKLHVCRPYCRHLKCIVSFNHLEKTWDCPCHGSRYDTDGNLIEGPAESSLKKVDDKV